MTDRPIRHLTGCRVALDDGRLAPLDVEVAGARVQRVATAGALDAAAADEVVDLTGRIVAPGFVDLQLNGGWGHDFTHDPGSIGEVARRLPSTGVTAFVPTIVTCDPEHRDAALSAWAASTRPISN